MARAGAVRHAAWAQLHLGTGTRVVSDGLACFHGVTAAGCVHEPVVVGSGRAAGERTEFVRACLQLGEQAADVVAHPVRGQPELGRDGLVALPLETDQIPRFGELWKSN